ncbi:MAG: DUF885 domain-containing protein [Terriglobia bacterium]
MTRRTVAFALTFVGVLCVAMILVQNMQAGSPKNPAEFNRLVDSYFDFYFQFHPKEATAAGFHQYDAKMEDYSRASRDGEISNLRTYASEFDRLDPAKLPAESAGDLAFLQSNIKGRLLELQVLQMWRKDANLYVGDATDSIFVIIKRTFAPPEERLRSVIARERQIPAVLMTARSNLSNPPKIYTQIAIEQMPGIIEFFQKDVPGAFPGIKDAALWTDFQQTNAAVVKALENFQLFLQDDLLPRSQGDFRIGADNFRQKLLDDEMVNIPLDQLLKIGYADLHSNQQRLKETAALINPNATPREVLATLEKDHPPADQLLPTFRNLLGGLREFIEAKKIVTIPSSILPTLEETPPFMRATTTASMDTPGAYETQATEAMFNVTLPEPGWTPQQVEDWMEGFNRGTILSTAIHEAYPGHYVQFLWVKRLNSKVRKLLFCNSNVEGWAHYTEQMMLDEGYGGGDAKLRMGQLQDALLRNARFIVGIEMHTGNMTMDQAKEFFIREGYQVPAVADVEAKRGTSDPTYLVYTLGKLQILKLRDDYKGKLGNKFMLQEFHDRFMDQGGVPLVIIRRTLLGDNSPTL